MVHGSLSGAASRRLCCICAPLLALFFFISYRNSVNEEIETLRWRLKVSVDNAESLATQLKVVNEHKEKIEERLKDEKRTKERIDHELTSLKAAIDRLTRQLNETQATLAICTTENAARHAANESTAPVPTRNALDSVTSELQNIPVSNTTIKIIRFLHTGVNNVNFTGGFTPVTNLSRTQIAVTIPLARQEGDAHLDEPRHENYAAGNSVHFHRHESVDKNVEFRRQQPGLDDHPGELSWSNLRVKEKDQKKNASPLLHILSHHAENRPVKKKGHRKDARENDDNEENVVDFRHDDDPDQKNAADYKEMPV